LNTKRQNERCGPVLGKGAMLQSRANFPEGEVARRDSRSMVPDSRAKADACKVVFATSQPCFRQSMG
jgi:hypothetical protein